MRFFVMFVTAVCVLFLIKFETLMLYIDLGMDNRRTASSIIHDLGACTRIVFLN